MICPTGRNPAVLQDPVHLVERGAKPCGVVVIAHCPPVSAPVVHKIGRVGEDEIHAPARHRPHEGNAVAVVDHITEGSFCIVGHVPDSLAGKIAGGSTLRASRRRVTARESWGQMTAGVAGLRASGATPCAVARPCRSVGGVWGKGGEGPSFPVTRLLL